MTPEKAILSILREQVKTYLRLHELLKAEREHLVKIDAEKVEEISKEKDTMVMRLRLLEEERQRLTKQYAADNNVDPDINLEKMGDMTGNPEFSELRSRLISLLQSIEEMNKFNSVLIEKSLKYVRTTSNFLNSFTSNNVPPTTGTLLSKES